MRIRIGTAALAGLLVFQAQADPFIDWAALKNPILSAPDRMLKDQAVVYADGWFYLFASTRFADDDPERDIKAPCIYQTRDFLTYECYYDPDLDVDWGLEYGDARQFGLSVRLARARRLLLSLLRRGE